MDGITLDCLLSLYLSLLLCLEVWWRSMQPWAWLGRSYPSYSSFCAATLSIQSLITDTRKDSRIDRLLERPTFELGWRILTRNDGNAWIYWSVGCTHSSPAHWSSTASGRTRLSFVEISSITFASWRISHVHYRLVGFIDTSKAICRQHHWSASGYFWYDLCDVISNRRGSDLFEIILHHFVVSRSMFGSLLKSLPERRTRCWSSNHTSTLTINTRCSVEEWPCHLL